MNTLSKLVALGLAGLLLTSSFAYAGKKPAGSKSAKASVVKKAISGKSWKWKKGGAYYAKNGKLTGTFDGSVGIGTWTVSSSGTLCNKATWYWNDDGVKKEKAKSCFKHVVDKNGKLWQRHHKKNDWYLFSKNKISNGNKFGAKINRMKKQIGI